MQYGSGQGVPELREQITDVMRLEGIEAHPDDVVVTVGSQQAVDLVTRVFCDPGDVVICEAPSYVGALGVFKAYQCEVVHAEMDADGLVPDALRQAIASVKAAGKTAQVPLHDPELPQPGRRDPRRRAPRRDPRDLPHRGAADPRGQPLRPARLRRRAAARAARRRGRGRHLSRARSPRPSRPGSGSAGRWPRTWSARSWCWPRSPRRSARRSSPRWRSRRTSPTTTGRARSSSSGRCTASGATSWSRRCTT